MFSSLFNQHHSGDHNVENSDKSRRQSQKWEAVRFEGRSSPPLNAHLVACSPRPPRAREVEISLLVVLLLLDFFLSGRSTSQQKRQPSHQANCGLERSWSRRERTGFAPKPFCSTLCSVSTWRRNVARGGWARRAAGRNNNCRHPLPTLPPQLRPRPCWLSCSSPRPRAAHR